MRVMDLSHWPPAAGGAFRSGDAFPQSINEVTIASYLIIEKGNVLFTCRFNKRVLIYRLFIANRSTAEQFIQILQQNHGKRLSDVGLIELPVPHSS